MIDIVQILRVVEIINDNVNQYEGLRPFLSTGDLNISTVTNLEDHSFIDKPSRANQNVKEGDILLARMQGTVKVKIIRKNETNIIVSTGFLVLRKKKNIDQNYLYHIFKSQFFQTEKDKLCTGATQKAINNANFAKLQIILPPLPQQQKIAAILDAADELRQKDKALVAKYNELTQALFLEMFGDPVTNPKGWEFKVLNELCKKITDGTHFSPEAQTEGIPYITAKHVKEYGLDFYSKPTYISKEAHKEIYKRCTPEFGDILYIKDGATTGIACINNFDKPFSMLSSLALIKPNTKKLNNYYLCFWLNNPKIKSKLLNEFMSGAAIQRYTLTKINSFQLIVPTIKLQNQFAERVKVIDEQKSIAQASALKSEELFNSLLQKAFNGALI